MNKKQKAIEALLLDAKIFPFTSGKYTVKDKLSNPVVRLSGSEAKAVLQVCKKFTGRSGPYWIIERRAIQRLHGNDWRYKAYRALLRRKELFCYPCPPFRLAKYAQPIKQQYEHATLFS